MRNGRKWEAYLLCFALLIGVTGGADGSLARESKQKTEKWKVFAQESVTGGGVQVTQEPEPTIAPKEMVTITPFSGQWKYYGQKREFLPDVHYATSDDRALPEGVSVRLESEDIGQQRFVVVDERTDEEKLEVGYAIEENAPVYEIKEYTTTAEIFDSKHIYNIEDKQRYEEEFGEDSTASDVARDAAGGASVSGTSVSGSGVEVSTGTMRTVLEAPEGYLVSSSPESTSEWKSTMEVELQEGDNLFTYYLQSNQKDNTRKAIDRTAKTITLKADWTVPQIVTLVAGIGSTDVTSDGQVTANEVGTYYYVVLPAEAEPLTQKEIEKNVSSHYGIVGFGRVDGTTKPSDFSFTGLMANKSYVVYMYVEDEAGNVSEVQKSDPFMTDSMALAGDVEITGTMAVGEELTAKANVESVAPGELSYQWYRIRRESDEAGIDEIWDETGGAEEDDLEADLDEEDDEEGEDDIEVLSVHKLAEDSDDMTTTTGATLIPNATAATYKTTREDIGCRLICSVTAEKYSGYIAGESLSFIPKLIPEYTLPVVAPAKYTPTRKLSAIKLPARWSWVDDTITPVYGNSGYRAMFIPEDTAIYKKIIVRVKVPVTKRKLKKSMVYVPKTRAYAGSAIKNNFSVEDGDSELELKKDFKVTYKKNKLPGKATITFRGIGNYKGTVKKTYKIKKRSVKSLNYKYSKTKVYNGRNRVPGVTIKNGKVRLKRNRDYTISYRNNRNMGVASITICGKKYYYGKKVLHFSIVPAKPKISQAAKKGNTLKLAFKGNRLIKGYYVYISTAKKFKKKATSEYMVSGNRLQIKKMEKGTRHHQYV